MAVASCLIGCIVLVSTAVMPGARSTPGRRLGNPWTARGLNSMVHKAVTAESDFRIGDSLERAQVNTEATALEPQTLVLYVFSNTDPQYFGNLMYFVKHGLPGCPLCDYVIIINHDSDTRVGADMQDVKLPELPSNARYLYHPNQCYDWGTFGWVFNTQGVDPTAYKHYVFLNSSVRGPFLPPYLQGKLHFTEAMKLKLVGDVKMVGPTINCEGTATLESGERRTNPHVQSFAIATDAVGMALLLRDGKVFGCYEAFQDTIYHSELGASAVILEAGYNLDSFMGRYQGVDWRDSKMGACNAGENPFNNARVDGLTLAPMELMFVKVKQSMVQLNYPSAVAAVAYDIWQDHAAAGKPLVLPSVLGGQEWEIRAPFILEMAAIGLECFDCGFYLHANPDLSNLSCWQAFAHFANYGQFEMRTHRFICDTSLTDKAVPYLPEDDGSPWPRPTTYGCSRCSAGSGNAEVEALRAQLRQVKTELEELRVDYGAMVRAAVRVGGDRGSAQADKRGVRTLRPA